MKVSVILCTKDRDDYLEEAVRSVLNQSHQDLELLLVDDGSERPLVETWRERLPDPRIRWLRTEGLGPGPNVRFGLEHVTSDVVALIGDDDRWVRSLLRTALRLLAEDKRAVVFSHYLIDETGQRRNKVLHPTPHPVGHLFYHTEFWRVPAGLVVYRKDVLEEVSREAGPCADFKWSLELLSKPGVVVSQLPLIEIRKHSEQMTVVRGDDVKSDAQRYVRETLTSVPLEQLVPDRPRDLALALRAGLYKHWNDTERAEADLEAIEPDSLESNPALAVYTAFLRGPRVGVQDWRDEYIKLQTPLLSQ
jgi:glycosyltransferase involved in cell wall biosynthesis